MLTGFYLVQMKKYLSVTTLSCVGVYIFYS